jgi:hypothetical protein
MFMSAEISGNLSYLFLLWRTLLKEIHLLYLNMFKNKWIWETGPSWIPQGWKYRVTEVTLKAHLVTLEDFKYYNFWCQCKKIFRKSVYSD